MKIRQGFVSNSSSSSFVIEAANKQTVLSVAFDMVPARNWDNRDTELQEKLLSFNGDPDTPIAFKSCNYDTFIIKEKNLIFVDTCNNHPWYDFINYRRATQEEMRSIGLDDFWEDFALQKLQRYYWWPEYNFFAKTLLSTFCKECYCEILQLQTDEKICPHCKKDVKEIGQ